METRQALATWIDRNTTQAAFAQSVGISEPHLSLLLQGRRGCSVKVAKKIESKTDGDVPALELMSERPESRGGA